PVEEDLFTRPIPQQAPEPAGDAGEGPSTRVGVAPVGAEDRHRARTDDARRDGAGTGLDEDGLESTGFHPGGLDDGFDDGFDDPRFDDGFDDPRFDDTGSGTPPVRPGESPAGLGGRPLDAPDDDVPPPRERRLGRGSSAREGAAPGWAAVVVQWIGGALGGAVLWVLFRFLWRNLPVVALASAVLVTVGLVVIVRALLHNDDRRTTVFAVLVGLLLTVSPAILVLMGR
ncbi:hypothetical protein I4I73_32900, partial [Pseudonocardia sp. KRD-184]|nr:hypothetical protein [Pseudonocardia oceani]MBW0100785.1 hypothetical protein [Pseudonocardia oceani]MBW0113621.1 hypothetical protein [Pseudonocardia oceani]